MGRCKPVACACVWFRHYWMKLGPDQRIYVFMISKPSRFLIFIELKGTTAPTIECERDLNDCPPHWDE